MNATRCTVVAALAAMAVIAGAAPVATAQQDAAQVEAVIETSKGAITMRFLPNVAPKHVQHFLETAQSGGYNGTTFFRAIPYAIIQGGDPVSKDPKKRTLYGTGGLKLLPDEFGTVKHDTGAVSAVAIPGAGGNPLPNSSGTQFFICDTPQPSLDGKYTVFAWVTDGMDVVRAISMLPLQGDKIVERVEIRSVTIRPVTPTTDEIGRLQARIVTPAGEIVMEFLPAAPDNARQFIRLARSGFYDGASIYRAIPGVLIQGASPEGWAADSPNRKRSFSHWNVPDEFSQTVAFDRGMVGMAHSDQPNSGSIHFFIMLSPAHHLDGKYTPFARVLSGIEVAEAISRQKVAGEQLTPPVIITRIVVEERK